MIFCIVNQTNKTATFTKDARGFLWIKPLLIKHTVKYVIVYCTAERI